MQYHYNPVVIVSLPILQKSAGFHFIFQITIYIYAPNVRRSGFN